MGRLLIVRFAGSYISQKKILFKTTAVETSDRPQLFLLSVN
jgi:hypothetical protein